jgi:hypothetical protein
MTLDYLDKVNDFGDSIVRLSNFDTIQADKFRKTIQQTIIKNKKQLDLATVDFVKAVNCSLTFRIADKDIGITTADRKTFFCDLTIGAYSQMTNLLEPFSSEESSGYQWLYDTNNPIDLLFSPTGTW